MLVWGVRVGWPVATREFKLHTAGAASLSWTPQSTHANASYSLNTARINMILPQYGWKETFQLSWPHTHSVDFDLTFPHSYHCHTLERSLPAIDTSHTWNREPRERPCQIHGAHAPAQRPSGARPRQDAPVPPRSSRDCRHGILRRSLQPLLRVTRLQAARPRLLRPIF